MADSDSERAQPTGLSPDLPAHLAATRNLPQLDPDAVPPLPARTYVPGPATPHALVRLTLGDSIVTPTTGPPTTGPGAAGPSAAGPGAAGPSAAGPSAARPSAAGPAAVESDTGEPDLPTVVLPQAPSTPQAPITPQDPAPAEVAPRSDTASTSPSTPETRTRTRAKRTRMPLVRPADITWFVLIALAAGLALFFLASAASRWQAGTQPGGAAIYVAIGIVLAGAAIAGAGYAPIPAVIVGAAAGLIPGAWWLIDPASLRGLLTWLFDRPLLTGLPALLDSGIPLLLGAALVVLGAATGVARLVGRATDAPDRSTHWFVAIACLALTIGASALLLLGNSERSRPAWFMLAGCAAAGVAFGLAKISALPAAVGGAILPLGLGAALLSAAGGGWQLPGWIATRFGEHLPAAAGQVAAVGVFMLAAAIAARLGRLPRTAIGRAEPPTT